MLEELAPLFGEDPDRVWDDSDEYPLRMLEDGLSSLPPIYVIDGALPEKGLHFITEEKFLTKLKNLFQEIEARTGQDVPYRALFIIRNSKGSKKYTILACEYDEQRKTMMTCVYSVFYWAEQARRFLITTPENIKEVLGIEVSDQ